MGELGDAADRLVAALEASTERPDSAVVLRTGTGLPMSEFPLPAHDLIELSQIPVLTINLPQALPQTPL